MCGLSVIVCQKNKKVDYSLIKASTDKIYHRGPDGEGFYFGSNFSLGHRRLAIIDLTEGGHQPMVKQDLVITFNGEIYNYIELRDELIINGFKFETQTDTEVIINAYKHWGYEFQNKLVGMWAFVIFDSNKNQLVCSRDRYSQKPLLYTNCGDLFLMGSEIKQFTVHSEFMKILNLDITYDFLENGLLNHSNQTFFKDVFSLSGGHQLIYNLSNHTFEVTPWYYPDFNEIEIDFESAKTNYENLLRQSLKLQNRSDVPIGFALSGGIDSSGIVCVTKDINPSGKYKAITSCYSQNSYDESFYAEMVVSKEGIEFVKKYPNLDDLITKKDLEKIIYHQEQPIFSASHFSEFSIFKEASNQDITVMLCGQGPDEHTAGYHNFFTYYNLELLKKFDLFQLLKNLKSGNLKLNLFRFIGFLFFNSFRFNYNKFINYKYFKKKPQSYPIGIFLEIDCIRKLSLDQIFRTSIPYQAHSEDRNSMCFSIESRSPYLDHNLLEFAVRLPSHFKIKGDKNKFILRETLKPYLPQEVYERNDKMGFVAPDEIWFRDNKNFVRPLLIESCNHLSAIINKELVIEHYDKFTEGKMTFVSIFMNVISLAVLCKIFNIKIQQIA